MTDFMHHEGTPVVVRGYGCVYDRFSIPIDRLDGRREIVKPGAFDLLVAVRPLDLTCCAYHLEGPGFASMWWRNLEIWTDSYGLAFEAGPIRPTPVNRHIVSAIVTNQLRVCSLMGTTRDSTFEMIDGEETHVIRAFRHIDHFGPVESAAYPDTLCWASHEDPATFSTHAQQIIAYWHANRPTERARSAVPSQPAPRVAASRSVRKQTNAVDWCEPPPGFTRDAWIDFGHREAHGRRQMRQAERARQNRKGVCDGTA